MILGFALALLALLACAGAGSPAPCGVDVELVDVRPGDVPSADLARWLRARRRGGRVTVLLDHEVLREGVDEVGRMGFLPDGTPHVAWRRGPRWWQQVGERASGPFHEVGPLIARGARHAFAARRGRRWHAVVDGQPGASWEAVTAIALSGDHAAWAVGQDARRLLLVDGHPVGAASAVELLDLRGDEPLWAAREGDELRVRVGRRELPGAWRAVGPGALTEGGWRVFVADERGWWALRHDAVEGPLSGEPLAFLGDARAVVLERAGPAVRARIGDRVGPWFESVELLDATGPEPLLLARGPEGASVRVGAWGGAPRGDPVAWAASWARGLVATAHDDARGGAVVLHRVGDPEPWLVEEARVLDDVDPVLAFGPADLRYLHRRDGRVFRREIPLRCLPERPVADPGPDLPSEPLRGGSG